MLTTNQVSSLEKVRFLGIGDLKRIDRKIVMRGEKFSYQIALESKTNLEINLTAESPLLGNLKIYSVKNAIVDYVTFDFADKDYIMDAPGVMPDILLPYDAKVCPLRVANEATALWVTVEIPADAPVGECPITFKFAYKHQEQEYTKEETMVLDIIDAEIPKQSTMFTQWFYSDCIANVHNVEIFSEQHWDLIEKYIAMAAEVGINFILTPVITPPLDTAVGTSRPCTQLVKIEKNGEKYIFDFTLLKRWVDLCHKHNVNHFEISHLFSQWGLKCAPNIWVTENGEYTHKFGWHVDARSDEYADFLKQFLPALIGFLKAEGIKDNCCFHLSDEPHADHVEAYQYAHDLVKPLLDGCLITDAISDYDFYEKGLMDRPVTATDFIQPFLDNNVQHQWAYYCCAQCVDVGNRFLAQASYRNRILGLQIYKFNIEGFLHWGYNFYNNQLSRQEVNPYVTTSSDKGFPSGDAFSVYPVKNGVIPSLRAIVFRDALNDVEICRKLESYIGREKVIELIDTEAGMDLTFANYPRNNDYIISLIEKMEEIIKSYNK
ncbi:MAG: DUF4091 domain-containing protein [Ruminococcaceae bacterium]|nr:DUF4091 domain-containing protein [Oscillospiraceae bacterium]